MQQYLPKTKEEAEALLTSLINDFIESLRHGAGSMTLEHDTIVEMAVELGSTRAMVKIMSRMDAKSSYAGLVALLVLWREKYRDLHGDDDNG